MTWSTSGTTSTGGYTTMSFGFAFNPDMPALSHSGPVEFSTCTDLAIQPTICHDVNGYYRELGVHWKASRADLRKAYLAKDGPNDARLTFIFKQLLNKKIRRAYDMSPLGSLFMDKYVWAWLKSQMLGKRSARGERIDRESDFEEEMRANGFVPTHDTPKAGVDASDESVDPDSEDPAESTPKPPPWQYAYYRWHTLVRDTERLARWQELLVSAFREKGIHTRLAVGYRGRMVLPWMVFPVGYRVVVFLNDEEQPTIAMARAVADRVVAQRTQAGLPAT